MNDATPHRIPGSTPDAARLQAVVHEGRKRRRRATRLVGTTALAGAAVAGVLSLSGGTATDTLRPADNPTASSTPQPAGPTPTPLPATPSATLPLPAGSPTPTPAPAGSASPGPQASAVPVATRKDATAAGATPYTETPTDRSDPANCGGGVVIGAPQGYTLCGNVSSDGSVRSGESLLVSVEVCNSATSVGDYTLRYETGQEHEVAVKAGRDTLWTWSRSLRFPQGPHERVLRLGHCLTWDTTWDTTDDAGRAVPRGAYTITATLLGADTQSFDVNVSVT